MVFRQCPWDRFCVCGNQIEILYGCRFCDWSRTLVCSQLPFLLQGMARTVYGDPNRFSSLNYPTSLGVSLICSFELNVYLSRGTLHCHFEETWTLGDINIPIDAQHDYWGSRAPGGRSDHCIIRIRVLYVVSRVIDWWLTEIHSAKNRKQKGANRELRPWNEVGWLRRKPSKCSTSYNTFTVQPPPSSAACGMCS